MTEAKRREWGSGSYTTFVYAVEARAAFGEIILHRDGRESPVGNLVLTPHEWKRIGVEYGPVGVPNHLEYYAEALSNHFLTYECATAIAAWLQAARGRHGCIETRLVQIEFKSSYSTREIGTTAPVNLGEEERQVLWALRDGREMPPREQPRKVDAVDPHAGITTA